jgi:hypothetical protein
MTDDVVTTSLNSASGTSKTTSPAMADQSVSRGAGKRIRALESMNFPDQPWTDNPVDLRFLSPHRLMTAPRTLDDSIVL